MTQPLTIPAGNSVETGAYIPMLQTISLMDAVNFLKRNVRLIAAIACMAMMLAVVIIYAQIPLYTATSIVAINVKPSNKMDLETVSSQTILPDDQAINSELDVIQSPALAEKVIRSLNLVADREFNSKPLPAKPADDKTDAASAEEAPIPYQVLSTFQSRLDVKRKPRSYNLQISFTSRSAQKAEAIANAVADAYITGQLENKFNAREKANSWLSKKLVELQKILSESERKVQVFREENNLLKASGMTVSEQQLSGLNAELVQARAALTQAEAKLANSRSSVDSTAEVLNSNLIQLLRTQEAEVLRKKADLSNRYGAKHPQMINVNAEIKDIESKIRSEISKIIKNIENEVIVAKKRLATLEESVKGLQGVSGESSRASMQLEEMLREMNANRALYEAFLARFKQTSEGSGGDQPDAYIISKAGTPHAPSSPRKNLIYLVALIAGCTLGVLIACAIEVLDNTFRNLSRVEHETHLPVAGMLLEIPNKDGAEKDTKLYDEALKRAFISVSLQRGTAPKMIMISSSIPDEGKTYFSHSFALMLAKSGKKTLLIDADFKRASLTKRMLKGVELTHCLNNVGEEGVTINDMLVNDLAPNLSFLPCNPMTDHSQELISSVAMQKLLEQLRPTYDHILFDTPPLMAVSDALIISKMSDICLFLVRWGKTPRQVVKAALKLLIPTGTAVSLLITRTDLKKIRGYGHGEVVYYYDKYTNY